MHPTKWVIIIRFANWVAARWIEFIHLAMETGGNGMV